VVDCGEIDFGEIVGRLFFGWLIVGRLMVVDCWQIDFLVINWWVIVGRLIFG